MTWQPIDSAPKDGTRVLCWHINSGLVLLSIPKGRHKWVRVSSQTAKFQPTHWWDFGDGKTMPEPPVAP